MICLTAEGLTKSYLERPILKNCSLSLEQGDKVGIVGVNGTGKTTLLNLLAGVEQPDDGCVTLAAGTRISYLTQNPLFHPQDTVLEHVCAALPQERREELTYEAKRILNTLGVTEHGAKLSELSGGQRKRAAIAAALVTPCDLLILDEPTNHLDSEMTEFLEGWLARFTGTLVMVTHDRYFLDRVTNRLWEIDHARIYRYDANYSGYLALREQRLEMAEGTERKRQSLIRRELQWIQRGARARGTKSRERIERFEELVNREGPPQRQELTLGSAAARLGKKTIELRDVSKSYDGRPVIRSFRYLLARRARIGVVGRNGAGKTTLLRLIAGQLEPDAGEVIHGATVKIGYFSQESQEMDPAMRVIDFVRQTGEYVDTGEGKLSASQMLEKFLFSDEMQYNTIGRLSGGERRRLLLLHVLMQAPNVLLLDEPTNDLDIQTLTILEDYLERFEGAVVAVSHDRYFLDKLADFVLEVGDDGEVREYLGGYSDYRARCKDAAAGTVREKKERPRGQVQPRERKKFTYAEQREYETIDSVIARLEADLAQISGEMEQSAADYGALSELMERRERCERELEQKMERWVYLQELAERFEP
ncbi:ABC-F family ATP-binding cassette domain-containing protein [Feifania hominis]|uniref:ABC-F family ATP-binding cassette domain-containing protein n=1 Tax=Feifania hominis TaxID=2763660 RepID=A0A926DCQ6_9FIRM|nr:ABC-F family ATP-binding cassette domain-containing protein [Feifania hominis]MBC8535693.1 ABC-F family ATP-binding cassette domain-containing protein [Feifania hominis]